jgi:predicted nucleic acid-binding protein
VNEAFIVNFIKDAYLKFQVLSPGKDSLLNASRLRDEYVFSYWDSLVISSALESGCSILYSEDMQNGQVINKKLTIKNPFK